MASTKPLYQRTWFIAVMSILLLTIVAGSLNGERIPDESATSDPAESSTASPSPAEETQEVETEPEPEPAVSLDPSVEANEATPSESPTADPNSDFNVSFFILSSNGQFRDLEKDVGDAKKRARDDQSFRLLGNVLEFSFNFGQLQSLDPPTAIAKDWKRELRKLERVIEDSSDAATGFVSGETTLSQMLSSLDQMQNRITSLRQIVDALD